MYFTTERESIAGLVQSDGGEEANERCASGEASRYLGESEVTANVTLTLEKDKKYMKQELE